MTTVDDTLAVPGGTTDGSEERPTGSELVVAVLTRRWPWLLAAELMLTAGLILRGAPVELWPTLAYITAACVTLAAVDMRHHRLPDVLTLGSYPVAAVLLLIPATADDQFQAWSRACIACLAVVLGLAVLGSVLGYGGGDAKLAGLLAMPLAWHSWGACLAGLWVGVLMASMSGVALFMTRRISRRDRFAAGPGLMAGAYLVLLMAI
jgi:leader peptidase (prepilin peptidase)/N-methyltransferase